MYTPQILVPKYELICKCLFEIDTFMFDLVPCADKMLCVASRNFISEEKLSLSLNEACKYLSILFFFKEDI